MTISPAHFQSRTGTPGERSCTVPDLVHDQPLDTQQNESGTSGIRVQAVTRAMAILVAVATSEYGLTARELQVRLGLQRQTTYLLLRTLIDDAFLVRGADGRHRLGLRVGTLSEAFTRQLVPDESVAPYVRRLAERTGETAFLTVRRGVQVILLAYWTSTSSHELQAGLPTLGLLEGIHARASGRVSLAWAPAEVREEFFAGGRLRRFTRATLTARSAFEAELVGIRQRGYAVCREELAVGVSTMAAPIDAGVSPFVLSLAAPTQRFDEHFDAYLAALLEVANVASSHS